eukprot:6610559-Prorocentrum_lima.AAC.1
MGWQENGSRKYRRTIETPYLQYSTTGGMAYPCHKMHYGPQSSPSTKEGTASCTRTIATYPY